MDERTQIIKLGKVLAEEQRRGCDNSMVAGGLGVFLNEWHEEYQRIRPPTTNGNHPTPTHAAVQNALALLQDYHTYSPDVRHDRLSHALDGLRAIFRTRSSVPPEVPTASVRSSGSARANAPPPMRISSLQMPLSDLAAISKPVARAFKRLGVHTVHDLLYHIPHRYDDYRSQKCIADLEIGAIETIVAMVVDVRTFSTRRGNSVGIEVQVRDRSGILTVVFFGSPWLAKQFSPGRTIVLSGQVKTYQGIKQMTSPDWEPYNDHELLHTGRLVPVHPLTKGLHERNARMIIKRVIDHATPLIEDYLPPNVRNRANLLPLAEAIRQIHFPETQQMLERARERLGFDEFLFIQIYVLQRKRHWQGEMGYPLPFEESVHQQLLNTLPFSLTNAQQRVLTEIFSDIQRHVPMARLLQGDVGSGKTIVAAAALLQAVANGMQGALMAPTQILAEQHHRVLCEVLGSLQIPRRESADTPTADWNTTLSPARQQQLAQLKSLLDMGTNMEQSGNGVRVGLLKGNLGKKDRRRVLEAIETGAVDIIVGTHALITEGVRYHNLGFVCIDEQHRFGVEQRERLKQKGAGLNPHLLVMTATPIPRTLTLTIYGELDTSLLDELPPGRQPIKTRWITRHERYKAYRHIRKELEKGRQAFVICPLVEESDKVDLPSAEEMHMFLQYEIFNRVHLACKQRDVSVGLIHGRMLPREKDEVMRAFRDDAFDILVATAVVEVGIDVPNATTILIDGAERFGLAQLHQFRGRVGRGAHQSYCILISDVENEITRQRLEAMEATLDGFRLAEIDLTLRGPGEFLGKRQSGTPDLKVARLADMHLLERARHEAAQILDEDPELALPQYRLLRHTVQTFWANAEGAS